MLDGLKTLWPPKTGKVIARATCKMTPRSLSLLLAMLGGGPVHPSIKPHDASKGTPPAFVGEHCSIQETTSARAFPLGAS